MTPEELAGKITIGTLIDRELPVYIQELQKIREMAKAGKREQERKKSSGTR
jgi:2-oxoglutarate ferredoxin oxidoreductase subunit beta